MSARVLVAAVCPACATALGAPAEGGSGSGNGSGCGRACGSGCSPSAGCGLVRCPGCGRSWPNPQGSRLAFRLAHWLARRRRARVARGRPQTARLRLAREGTIAAGAAAGVAPAMERALTLADLEPGTQGRIVALTCAAPERLQQLTALGLVPGTLLRLQRRRPTVVVEVDQTLLALERQVAAEIRLEPVREPSIQPALSQDVSNGRAAS